MNLQSKSPDSNPEGGAASNLVHLDEYRAKKPQVIDYANRHQLVIVAMDPSQEKISEDDSSLQHRSAA